MEEPSSEPREVKPANLVLLKTNTTALRDDEMVAMFFCIMVIYFYFNSYFCHVTYSAVT